MTNAQTEARAIARKLQDVIEGHSWRLNIDKATDIIATALAAKDAELVEMERQREVERISKEHARRECDRAEAQRDEALKALEPFAKIKPSTACAEDGSEAEPYRVFLAARDDFDFTGADLAAARRALEAQGGEDVL